MVKFNGILADPRGIDTVYRVVNLVNRMGRKKCVVRLTPTEMCILKSYDVREGIAYEFRILAGEVFASYNMEGIDAEHNAFYFEISAKDFAHSLTLRETQIKIKLIKKNNTPHLKIDLVSNSIVNEVPITFIMVKNWAEYNLPNIGTPSVSIVLPSSKVLGKYLSSTKNMGSKNIVAKGNNDGHFFLEAQNTSTKMVGYMHGHIQKAGASIDSQELHSSDQSYSVTLDMKTIQPFISGLQNFQGRLVIKIVQDKGVIFQLKEPECLLLMHMSGLNEDD